MSDKASSNGLGLGVILAMIFMVLKLCGIITWSWLWVLCPVWIPVVIAIVAIIALAVMDLIERKKEVKNDRLK